MDNFLSPITHRPSLSYQINAINPEVETGPYYDRPRYFQQVSNRGNTAYNGFARRKPGPWMTKLFRPRKHGFTTLFTGSCLPCVLYGKTQYRLKQMAEGEDPLDLSRQHTCNGPCWMFGMVMCCVGFEWLIVMLQHSRIRATYNIDGTAGGDCVQSLFCSRCTLMQDEWEIIAREERILLERKEAEINRQPGQQQQMRYSTSNLFEEVPEVFRPVAVSGHMNETIPRVPTPKPGEQETNADEPPLQDVRHREYPQKSIEGAPFYKNSRQSGHSPRKLAVRKSSPIGSALNPITRRSSSADLGRPSDSKLPQRSATNPTRPTTLVSPVRYPSPNFLSYRSRAKGTDGILDMPAGFGTINEEAKSEDFSPSIRSDVGVKSFAMGSIYSGCSLRQGQSDARADESVIVYYGHEDRPQHHRLSDIPRSRPMTPEPNGTQVATLDGVAGRLESVDEDDGNADECNCGLDTRQVEVSQGQALTGKCGNQGHGEELFARLSTPTAVLRRFSISPSEMADDSPNLQALNSASEVTGQYDGMEPARPLGRAGSLIRYLVDIDKYWNIPTGRTENLSNISIARSNDPSNDSFKSIMESLSSDVVESGVAVGVPPKDSPDLFDNGDSDSMRGNVERTNRPVAKDGAHETVHRLHHGESSATDFADSTSKALDSIADDWIELSSLETFPAALGVVDLRTSQQSAQDNDLQSEECDFISAEQHMSDAFPAQEATDEGLIVSLAPDIAGGDGGSHDKERCSTPHADPAEAIAQADEPLAAESSTQADEPLAAEPATLADEPLAAEPTTQQLGEPATTANPLSTETNDLGPKTTINSMDSAPQMTSKDKNLRAMRRSSKKSRNRRNRKRRAAAETARVKP
ncbi:hypothetical protein V494_05692 [Pseudogymnoascus sp. VKM F-4513 (FW-928)]|nr:hypothetical protein V494_05692 [Pseudogymnoascus sp. VKM F-4513 (FW-928)]